MVCIQTGFYNEIVIPQLIEELDLAGKHDEAAQLRTHWEKKVAFFVSGGPNLFGSGVCLRLNGLRIDAGYRTIRAGSPADTGDDTGGGEKFAEKQIRANLFCRGVVEKAYYYYGSDYRGGGGDAFTLTYMSPMGGWGVLDHALHDRREPDATIRLGFASIVSSWSLMNTGTKEKWFRLLVSQRRKRRWDRRRFRACGVRHDMAWTAAPPRPLVLLVGN